MKINPRIHQLTEYHEINNFLEAYTLRLLNILEQKIVGVYLTGSLSYGDFNIHSSDIDITNITTLKLNTKEIASIKHLHAIIENDFPKWSGRSECSYTPIDMLQNTLPPAKPRPWYDGTQKHFYEEAPYGNEWIINKYLLYAHAIPLAGSDFRAITNAVNIKEVQKACIRDIQTEWKPKINDQEYLSNSHYASYFVLNLCRIIYTVLIAHTGTKKQSSAWAQKQFPQLDTLIRSAREWEYGKEMTNQKMIIDFARFVFQQIEETDLFKELNK
jgi:hypothetical protein